MPSAEDYAAYSRMRMRGLWPGHIEGAAAVEADATRERLTWAAGMSDEEIAEERQGMVSALDYTDSLDE